MYPHSLAEGRIRFYRVSSIPPAASLLIDIAIRPVHFRPTINSCAIFFPVNFIREKFGREQCIQLRNFSIAFKIGRTASAAAAAAFFFFYRFPPFNSALDCVGGYAFSPTATRRKTRTLFTLFHKHYFHNVSKTCFSTALRRQIPFS